MTRSLALILVLLLTGCGLLPKKVDETKNWSADKLYTEAKSQLDDGNYEQAIKYFETLEARYPYGRYATQAEIEVAYAYYKDGESTSAVAACERFIKLHPTHPNVDYAYYLKGLANFNEDLGILGNLAGTDLSDRDPKAGRESFEAFKELVTRFPQSRYAADAAARMKYLVNALAAHEVGVAQYYMERGAYVAAANRAQYSLVHYSRAPANEEALTIMVQAYDKLGVPTLRDDTERVLQQTYPRGGRLAAAATRGKKPWWKFW